MEQIQVGEFVRIKDCGSHSGISKIKKIEDAKINLLGKKYYCKMGGVEHFFLKEDIAKHSFSKTDLIEEGDYVNGDKIVKIEEDIYIGGLNLWTERDAPDGFGGFYRVKYREKDIKSIVTKEQFKAIEYVIKEG